MLFKYLNPSNWYYFTIGYLRKYLYKSQQDNIVKVATRAAKCSDCFLNGYCKHCGCSSYEMFLSGKPCPNEN
jgi:hypothetical protein